MPNRSNGKSPDSTDEDRATVAARQKGDAAAFQPLVEKCQKRMLGLAYRMTGGYEEACGIAQEGFRPAFGAYGNSEEGHGLPHGAIVVPSTTQGTV